MTWDMSQGFERTTFEKNTGKLKHMVYAHEKLKLIDIRHSHDILGIALSSQNTDTILVSELGLENFRPRVRVVNICDITDCLMRHL